MQRDSLIQKKIILGSQSPRRSYLLSSLALKFEVRIIDVVEDFDPELTPEEVVLYLAELKSKAYLSDIKQDEILICADTVVSLNGQIIGKPKNFSHAKSILKGLSNRCHDVYTGVCIMNAEKSVRFADYTEVEMMPLTESEIEFYLHNYEAMDKAGAYGIQDWIGYAKVKGIKGSYANVMGLPVHRVYQELLSF